MPEVEKQEVEKKDQKMVPLDMRFVEKSIPKHFSL